MPKITYLEKRAALQILLYLCSRKKANRTELRENIKSSLDALYSAIPILVSLGLVEEKKQSKRFPFEVEVELTEKGEKVARYLFEIEKILEG